MEFIPVFKVNFNICQLFSVKHGIFMGLLGISVKTKNKNMRGR